MTLPCLKYVWPSLYLAVLYTVPLAKPWIAALYLTKETPLLVSFIINAMLTSKKEATMNLNFIASSRSHYGIHKVGTIPSSCFRSQNSTWENSFEFHLLGPLFIILISLVGEAHTQNDSYPRNHDFK